MNDSQPIPKPAYEPNFFIRLLTWAGIYLAAQLPLIPYRAEYSYFPFGLLQPFLILASKIVGKDVGLPEWTLRVCYAFYLAHLVATLVVRRRKTFLILIWTLVGLVLFNLAGCELSQHLH